MNKLRTVLLLMILLSSQFLLSDRDKVAHAQQTSLNDAVPAVVRILGCNVAGCNVGLGSGVLIHASGVVLTANHVTLADLNDPTSQLEDFLIEMTTSAQLPPQARYRARLIAFKPESDLALLRIYWDENANQAIDVTTLQDLPTLPLANAETIMLGEEVHILGYPLAGGRAINYAQLVVGGFDEGGALIKVSTTLSEGNSGGPALVERNGRFEIAGIVLRRRGTLGEIGFIRRIDQLQEMIWLANTPRVWVDSIQVSTQGTGATASLQISAEIHALDMVNRHIYLLAYAFEATTYLPWRPSPTGLPKSATGQVVFSQAFVAQQVIAAAQTMTLEQHGLGVDPQQLRFRLLLWDSEATQVLWQDTEWRSPQPATAVVLAPPPPTATQTAIPTPVLLPPTPTATLAPPTATTTMTPLPDLIASATAIAQMVATAIAATQTALPTNTPTSTPTPNLAATTTAEARRQETAIAATLTAQPAATPTATQTPSFDQVIATAVAATLTALPADTPTRMPTATPTTALTPTRTSSSTPTKVPTATWTPTRTPTRTPTPPTCKPGVLYCEDFEDGRAAGWRLGPKWQVKKDGSNFVLSGENQEWATLVNKAWADYRVRFRLKLLYGTVHLIYRLNESQLSRYWFGFSQNRIYLHRTLGSGYTELTTVPIPHSLNRWYNLEIAGWKGRIQLYVDGELVLDYNDSTPLLQGTIVFETLDNSAAQIDDIEVMAAGPEPAPLQTCTGGLLYCEDFESGPLQGWWLDAGWQRTQDGANSVLSGEGHYWATVTGQAWNDYRVRFRLKLVRGAVHLIYRLTDGPTRYFIGFQQEGLYLARQVREAFTDLTSVAAYHELSRWHDVEIVGRRDHLQVFVDGKLELDYTDQNPLLKGSIAFETLDDSFAQVDDIEVAESGPEQVSSQTSTPGSHPELVIDAANLNVRDGPGSSYKVLGVAKSGERYTITGRNGNSTWWQIDFNGRSGWVSGGYVRVLSPDIAVPIIQAATVATPSPTVSSVAPATWTNPTDGAAYIFVPSGPFIMGSTDVQVDAALELCNRSDCQRYYFEDEQPQHTVDVNDFWIMKTEVTNSQFRTFVKTGGYNDERFWSAEGWQWVQENKVTQPAFWGDANYNGPNQPVVGISWYEATAYARWLSEHTGQEIRLPTEAEWEKAARGTDGRIYPWGDRPPDGTRLNHSGEDDGNSYTAPVGSYPAGASLYGVLDMVGNVWEWTYHYNPGNSREDRESGDARPLRGGSFGIGEDDVRCASRIESGLSRRVEDVGFRVVKP